MVWIMQAVDQLELEGIQSTLLGSFNKVFFQGLENEHLYLLVRECVYDLYDICVSTLDFFVAYNVHEGILSLPFVTWHHIHINSINKAFQKSSDLDMLFQIVLQVSILSPSTVLSLHHLV